MINLFNTHIETLSIHKVGNKSRNEAIFLSDNQYGLNDEIVTILKEYFFKSFREKEENYYQFAHEVDLEYNEMFKLADEIFTNPSAVHEVSKKITQHLFEQSNHPHIKNGEVYVTYLTNVSIVPECSPNAVISANGTGAAGSGATFKQTFEFIVTAINNNIIRVSGGALGFPVL